MEVIIQFLKDNWSLVISVVVLILSFVLQLIKKKSQNVLIDEGATSILVDYVLEAEEKFGSGHGQEKLQYVVKKFLDRYPLNKHILCFESSIACAVEKILSTPHKKD